MSHEYFPLKKSDYWKPPLFNRVGGRWLFHLPASHTTVRNVQSSICSSNPMAYSFPPFASFPDVEEILNATALSSSSTLFSCRQPPLWSCLFSTHSNVSFRFRKPPAVWPFPERTYPSRYYGLCWLLMANLVSTVIRIPSPHVHETSAGKRAQKRAAREWHPYSLSAFCCYDVNMIKGYIAIIWDRREHPAIAIWHIWFPFHSLRIKYISF